MLRNLKAFLLSFTLILFSCHSLLAQKTEAMRDRSIQEVLIIHCGLLRRKELTLYVLSGTVSFLKNEIGFCEIIPPRPNGFFF